MQAFYTLPIERAAISVLQIVSTKVVESEVESS
jgi:hypothetical protein